MFKRHPWKIDKVLKYFWNNTPCIMLLWKSSMKCFHVRSLQVLPNTWFFTYLFFQRINAWLEWKAKVCEMNLFKKENLSSNCRRHNETWSNGHLFMDCHQPSPKASCLLPPYHFLRCSPTADDRALPLPQASHVISRLCFPFSEMKYSLWLKNSIILLLLQIPTLTPAFKPLTNMWKLSS